MANLETFCHICHISYDHAVCATHDCSPDLFELEENEHEICQPDLATSTDLEVRDSRCANANDTYDTYELHGCAHNCDHDKDSDDNYADIRPEGFLDPVQINSISLCPTRNGTPHILGEELPHITSPPRSPERILELENPTIISEINESLLKMEDFDLGPVNEISFFDMDS